MMETFEQALDQAFTRMRKVMIDRQLEYGPDNILATGIHGVIVRMRDNLARIEHEHRDCPFGRCIVNAAKLEYTVEAEEKRLNAYVDLGNYAGVISTMLLTGTWGLPLHKDDAWTRYNEELVNMEDSDRLDTLQMLDDVQVVRPMSEWEAKADPAHDARLALAYPAPFKQQPVQTSSTMCVRCQAMVAPGATMYWDSGERRFLCTACACDYGLLTIGRDVLCSGCRNQVGECTCG